MRDLLLLGVAAVGTLNILPMVMDRYFGSSLAAALVLAAGATLVGAALAMRRRSP